MGIRQVVACLAVMLTLGSVPCLGQAGADSVLGKWLGKAETPNGPLDMEFELRRDGNQILGSAVLLQQTIPMSGIKFQEPELSMQLKLGESEFRLVGVLQNGAFTGTWEQIGGESKGTWTAQRAPAQPAATTPPASGGISGTWHTVAVTDNRQLEATLQMKNEGETVTGTIGSDAESFPLQSASFKENRLQFDIDLNGVRYRVQGTLDGDKISGAWGPADGGAGGAFTATREPATASPAPPAASVGVGVSVEGVWDSVAATPDGDLPFTLEISKSGNSLTATVSSGGESMPAANVSFIDAKLTFEVDYAGGRYRIEARVIEGKLAGKWSAVGGYDTGAWSAQRRKP